MSKRQRMLARNKSRRLTEYRATLCNLFSQSTVDGMTDSDVIEFGSALTREMRIQTQADKAQARAQARAQAVREAKSRAQAVQWRAECAEKKAQAIA